MVLHLFQIFKGGPVHIDESSSWRSLKNRPRNLLVDSVAHTLTVVKCWHLHLTLDQFLQLNFSYLFSGVWIQPQWKPYQKLSWEGRGCPGWSQVLWVSCSSPQGELMWHLLSSHAGLALASGLAATVTITHMLKSGDGIICMDDVYGGEEAICGSDSCAEKYDALNACRFLVVGGLESGRPLSELWCFFFLTCKAQTATSKELPVIWVWRWRWLTVPNQSSLRLPWGLTPK